MDLKIVLLVGLVVGLVAAAFLLWPSSAPAPLHAAEIVLEGGITPWTAKLRPSSDLMLDTASVRPRISVSHAATSDLVTPLSPAAKLIEITESVASRIVVHHAATSASIPVGTETAPSMITSSRILIEHAATAIPIGPINRSSGLQTDSMKVSRKILIENAEAVETGFPLAVPLSD